MLLLAYYFPFIFELQVIYQLRENRDKGEARLLFWAFLVLCENRVEESEFFYLCPEQGVMKSGMILYYMMNRYAGKIFTSLINNPVCPCCTTPLPPKCNRKVIAWPGWLSLSASPCAFSHPRDWTVGPCPCSAGVSCLQGSWWNR